MLGAMQSGGKLLDQQGMYSCVFTSSLHCKSKKDQPSESEDSILPPLSKLIRKDDAEVEFGISNIIRQIPLWKNYFAVAESICEPSKKQTDKDFKECDIIENEPLSDFRILSMPYRGVSLHSFHVKIESFDIMNFVSHLLEAGALLTLCGIVHRDLHHGNILVDSHNIPRIIDFNLSILVKNELKSIEEDDLSHKHSIYLGQEPPDSTLVNAIANGRDGYRVIDSIISDKPILRKIQTLFGISPQQMKAHLYEFYHKSKSVKDGDMVAWFKFYWRMIDSWAIGVNIISLIMKLAIWPTFSIESHKPILFPILRKMCEINPNKRIDCVQALYQLNPNHFIIQKYGKEWINKVGAGQ
jgi:serine/threonine protein kinase